MFFTINQIENAHKKVQSGADFPKYIQEIKELGVISFETWVIDSHTNYYGTDDFFTKSIPKYDTIKISENCTIEKFKIKLKEHQQGKTNYLTFCNDCATCGIEKWIVNIYNMTCIYYDKKGIEILTEQIPAI